MERLHPEVSSVPHVIDQFEWSSEVLGFVWVLTDLCEFGCMPGQSVKLHCLVKSLPRAAWRFIGASSF